VLSIIFIFGTHYRKIYGTLIDSKTASLDTLYGGLTPQRAGGGHQTKSLRLTDPDGKEYVMRAVKKSVGRFYKMLLSKINTSRMSLEIPMQKVFFMILYYFTSFIRRW
jgi:hypothetical protein